MSRGLKMVGMCNLTTGDIAPGANYLSPNQEKCPQHILYMGNTLEKPISHQEEITECFETNVNLESNKIVSHELSPKTNVSLDRNNSVAHKLPSANEEVNLDHQNIYQIENPIANNLSSDDSGNDFSPYESEYNPESSEYNKCSSSDDDIVSKKYKSQLYAIRPLAMYNIMPKTDLVEKEINKFYTKLAKCDLLEIPTCRFSRRRPPNVRRGTDWYISKNKCMVFQYKNSKFWNNVTSSYPYGIDHKVVLVPRPEKVPQYEHFLKVFDVDVILLNLLATLGICYVLYIGNRTSHMGVTDYFFNMLQILFNSSMPNLRKITGYVKYLLMLWVFCMSVNNTQFNCLLTSMLVSSRAQEPIKTIEELSKSNFSIYIHEYFIRRGYIPSSLGLNDKFIRMDDQPENMLYSKFQNNCAFVVRIDAAKFYINFHKNKDGQSQFAILKESLIPGIDGYTLQKNSPLISLLNFSQCVRILGIFPTPSYSHQLVFQPLWKELSLRGHNVTVITTHSLVDPNLTNLTEIDISFTYNLLSKYGWPNAYINLPSTLHKLEYMCNFGNNLSTEILEYGPVQNILDQHHGFDLVMLQLSTTTNLLLYSLAFKYHAPIVDSLNFIQCVRILGIFPTPSYSHQIVFQPIWKELSLRGHNVTVITPYPLCDSSLTNLTEIAVSFVYGRVAKYGWPKEYLKFPSTVHRLDYVLNYGNDVTMAVLEYGPVQHIIDQHDTFDLLIVQLSFNLNLLLYSLAFKFHNPIVVEMKQNEAETTKPDDVGSNEDKIKNKMHILVTYIF
ncbi:unnamed protein product [Diabrotica balteata]|uniref:Uncharacterized protein n=1 Tax=Diabrotica balteata TaxID=107213 RepID=A0A9N9TBA6_DIABA|nr:unnamed protein product [Diabrotica balteata]